MIFSQSNRSDRLACTHVLRRRWRAEAADQAGGFPDGYSSGWRRRWGLMAATSASSQLDTVQMKPERFVRCEAYVFHT
jgi:hypothetical protein